MAVIERDWQITDGAGAVVAVVATTGRRKALAAIQKTHGGDLHGGGASATRLIGSSLGHVLYAERLITGGMET